MIFLLSLVAFTLKAQSDFIPETVMYSEYYQLEEKVSFFLPDESSIELMTEWDWIDMEPHREITTQARYLDDAYDSYSRIGILESDYGNEWDIKIDRVIIGPERSVMYTGEEEVSNMGHDSLYLYLENADREDMIANGLKPLTLFPPSHMVFHDGIVYYTASSNLYAVNTSTGRDNME